MQDVPVSLIVFDLSCLFSPDRPVSINLFIDFIFVPMSQNQMVRAVCKLLLQDSISKRSSINHVRTCVLQHKALHFNAQSPAPHSCGWEPVSSLQGSPASGVRTAIHYSRAVGGDNSRPASQRLPPALCSLGNVFEVRPAWTPKAPRARAPIGSCRI